MAISYIYTGEPMIGTDSDNFFIGYQASTGTDNNTVNANGGDDLVIGDIGNVWIPDSSYLNGSIATAFNLESQITAWTTAENPMFGDSDIPHTTVIAEATIDQSEFYRVQIGAGQQIIIDIDFGSNTPIGVTRDLIVELQDSLGNILATADDSLVTQGGRGSFPSSPGSASSFDPYLSYTVTNAGTYYINVRPFGGGPGSTFTENNTFVMNVSVTGHAVAAANPVQGADVIDGGAGHDALFGHGGNDVINGGSGNDYIDAGSGADIVHGGPGKDTIWGGDGSEENIHGDAGDDILYSGGEGHYYGDGGNDIIYAGNTTGINEVLDGGPGRDTLDTTTWGGTYTINLATGSTDFGEIFINFENLITGNGDDTITGTSGANVISTNGGVDIVNAGGGRDIVAGGSGGDTLNGGPGFDFLDYRTSPAAVTIDLASNTASGGHADGDTISNFEGVFGSNYSDTLTGSADANKLFGFHGADLLGGRGGDDILDGGNGEDTLNGAAGNDVLNGGLDADTMRGGIGNDFYYVDNADDTVVELNGEGIDRVQASISHTLADNVENLTLKGGAAVTGTGNALGNVIRGTTADNTLSGLAGADELYGKDGDDSLHGGGGNDRLEGGAGRDTISGANGDDQIVGGANKDTLFGGNGADTFFFGDGEVGASASSADIILDFDRSEGDKIHVRRIDANTGAGGDQNFTWIGNGAFTGVAGQLHYVHAGPNTFVEGDTNGDGVADFVIRLDGLHNLGAQDFVL